MREKLIKTQQDLLEAIAAYCAEVEPEDAGAQMAIALGAMAYGYGLSQNTGEKFLRAIGEQAAIHYDAKFSEDTKH